MKKGILLVNLGSPDSTKTRDVRKYLDEFLMDERVIDIAYWKRYLLIKGIILNTRPQKSAKAYKKIWWDEGSPLVVISERFTKKVADKLHIPVALGMRYGSMSIKKGIQKLHDQGVEEILLIPLYPHYAMSSYETVVEKAKEVNRDDFPSMKINTLPVFYNNEAYITAMSTNIKNHLDGFEYDHVLFSYHGIPERHIYKSDTTKSHCKLDKSCCNTPSKATDFELEKFPEEGKKKLAVVTPAFVADCLETLEEIAMEGKEEFMEAGGTSYKHIPCMNDNDDWVDVMVHWIEEWHEKTVLI